MAEHDLEIRKCPMTGADARRMIEALNDELSRLYPEEGANHFRLDREEVEPGRGAFVMAYRQVRPNGGSNEGSKDRPVGCGGVRRIDAETAEIKRMYVVQQARGQGVGAAVLEVLVAIARDLGARRAVLETGDRQPQALALYERNGFRRIPPFGEYIGSPLSVCMERAL